MYRERLQSQTLGGKSNEDSEAIRYAKEREKNFVILGGNLIRQVNQWLKLLKEQK